MLLCNDKNAMIVITYFFDYNGQIFEPGQGDERCVSLRHGVATTFPGRCEKIDIRNRMT